MISFQQQVDNEIDEGKAISEMMKTEGFKLFQNYLSSLRDEATYMVMAVDAGSIRNRERLRTLDEVMSIPHEILKRDALRKQNEDENGNSY